MGAIAKFIRDLLGVTTEIPEVEERVEKRKSVSRTRRLRHEALKQKIQETQSILKGSQTDNPIKSIQ